MRVCPRRWDGRKETYRIAAPAVDMKHRCRILSSGGSRGASRGKGRGRLSPEYNGPRTGDMQPETTGRQANRRQTPLTTRPLRLRLDDEPGRTDARTPHMHVFALALPLLLSTHLSGFIMFLFPVITSDTDIYRDNLTISDFEIWFMRPRFAIPCMSQSGSSLPPL